MNFNGDDKSFNKKYSTKEEILTTYSEFEFQDKSRNILLKDLINSIGKILCEILEENPMDGKIKKNGNSLKNLNMPLHSEELLNEDYNQIFFSKKPPKITIIGYLERIVRYSKTDESTLIIMLIYIDRLCDFNNIILNKYNIHRIIISSVLLAIKYNEDDYFSNMYYAKVGGTSLKEINFLEIEFMKFINYSLFVNENLFNTYRSYLNEFK
jgi:hypothetical protein